MSAWEAPPAIMQNMVVLLGTDIDIDEFMLWCSLLRLAPIDEIRSRSSHSILDNIGEKGGKNKTYEKAQYRYMRFMYAWSEADSPEDQNEERNDARVGYIPCRLFAASLVCRMLNSSHMITH